MLPCIPFINLDVSRPDLIGELLEELPSFASIGRCLRKSVSKTSESETTGAPLVCPLLLHPLTKVLVSGIPSSIS